MFCLSSESRASALALPLPALSIAQTQDRDKEEEKFSTHSLKIKRCGSGAGFTLGCSNLLCSQLPVPAIRGGRTGAARAPMAPSLATAFKVGRCDARGLDVCLVPSMQSYHYPCLLTMAGRLCYICSSRPWAMTPLYG